MSSNHDHREIFMTLVIGQKWLDNFNKEFRESFERYAKKYDFELVLIDTFIKTSDKRAPWQKLLIFDHPRAAPYERAMFMDADIYITKHARSPFDFVENKPWGIVQNNSYNIESWKVSDLELYRYCPPENRPATVINSGVFVISRSYKPMLEMIYDKYPEQKCCDNGPLSYHLSLDGKGIFLPPEFNTIVYSYRLTHGQGLSAVLKMYKDNSFIHFAGNKGLLLLSLIRYIDTHEDALLTKLIYFLGRSSLDWMTAPILAVSEKIRAFYLYHIKKKLLKK